MREREFSRRCMRDEKLKKLEKAQQIEAEKQFPKSIFKLARMLTIHQIIEALFGGKK